MEKFAVGKIGKIGKILNFVLEKKFCWENWENCPKVGGSVFENFCLPGLSSFKLNKLELLILLGKFLVGKILGWEIICPMSCEGTFCSEKVLEQPLLNKLLGKENFCARMYW